ncbi:universal stress protein [Uliginosibacterium paludis]|uniref:Universal stress protein n=1 Tax=Uliginosibacterium paludis TaxID=1615952 RepID=A0ABV2CK56_9RHOO
MYKHLLVPTDGTELSSKAVDSAVALAKTLDAQITFLYIQPDFPLPIAGEGTMLAPESREDFARGTEEQARKILNEASEVAKRSGVEANAKTAISDVPYEVIIESAQQEHCDLVFMASHGRKGLAGLLIGSETHKVLTHCKIPVLVYR